jgi:hypothetical protein
MDSVKEECSELMVRARPPFPAGADAGALGAQCEQDPPVGMLETQLIGRAHIYLAPLQYGLGIQYRTQVRAAPPVPGAVWRMLTAACVRACLPADSGSARRLCGPADGAAVLHGRGGKMRSAVRALA